MAHPFLSDEWIKEAQAIRAEYRGRTTPIPHTVRMNMVITELPFGDGQLDAHMDTSQGELELDKGHLDEADLTVTVDYATARDILVEGNVQAGMQAFIAGRVRVEGDMAMLMVLTNAGPPDETTQEMGRRIRELTD